MLDHGRPEWQGAVDACSCALARALLARSAFTGAKSFADNPLIGSPRLNALGLHAGRARLAQAMTARRRKRLAAAVDPADRAAFDRDGVVEIRDFLPGATFRALQDQLFSYRGPAREMVQGDTITRRLALDPAARRAIPAFEAFRRDARWQALSRYVSGFDIEPLLYVQSILPQRRDAAPDRNSLSMPTPFIRR